jgi:8-oxo-dGTP diphosphatase
VNLRLVHVAHRLTRNQIAQERLDLFFETSMWSGDIRNAEPDKCDDLSWYEIDRLPDDAVPLIKCVLHDVGNGAEYSEYSEEPI